MPPDHDFKPPPRPYDQFRSLAESLPKKGPLSEIRYRLLRITLHDWSKLSTDTMIVTSKEGKKQRMSKIRAMNHVIERFSQHPDKKHAQELESLLLPIEQRFRYNSHGLRLAIALLPNSSCSDVICLKQSLLELPCRELQTLEHPNSQENNIKELRDLINRLSEVIRKERKHHSSSQREKDEKRLVNMPDKEKMRKEKGIAIYREAVNIVDEFDELCAEALGSVWERIWKKHLRIYPNLRQRLQDYEDADGNESMRDSRSSSSSSSSPPPSSNVAPAAFQPAPRHLDPSGGL